MNILTILLLAGYLTGILYWTSECITTIKGEPYEGIPTLIGYGIGWIIAVPVWPVLCIWGAIEAIINIIRDEEL